MAEHEPAVEYDHHSAEYATDWSGVNCGLRDTCPVGWSDAHDGFWVLTSYPDVAAAARDHGKFSSDHDLDGQGSGFTGVAIPPPPVHMIPLEVDPPAFHAYRRLLNPAFSPAAAERWKPFARDVARACIDASIEGGRIDLVLDLANPVPAIVTLAILGLPLEDWEKYAEPMHAAVYAPPGSDEHIRAAADQLWIVEQLIDAVARRRSEPTDDLLSRLATEPLAHGEPPTETEAVAMAYTVMAGGVDTTTALIANALVWLAANPGERRRLIDDPSLVPGAVEEFLRFFSPVQAFARTATADTEIGGCPIRAGERVLLSWSAANRDPANFDDPDELRFERSPNRHLAFGLGVHRCLGSSLARYETHEVLVEVLTRMPEYEVDPDTVERYESIGNVNGLVRAPAQFAPGPRLGSPRGGLIDEARTGGAGS